MSVEIIGNKLMDTDPECEPMREKELREFCTCSVCNEKIGQKKLPVLWKLKAERHGIKFDAIQRQQGLTMMLGGHAAIAAAMSPNEPMTIGLSSKTIMVCDECMLERMPELFRE